ncbi:glycine oxidase ThiO [Microbulbifer agarilyticus]|uniref:glycine oxidase ThiO n=1 Tax=Microbulbifer agarilyticus TaxID=260552 RepID=UPI001CD38484|nr:glycine oxidase ThiO [Microbulbifer agarilyticus]MCA0901903.1 glycine oxidase ThiO [Microbulbifer agarilyticus]
MAHVEFSIAIAGAGLMGRLLAWRLSTAGYRVSLFDTGSLDNPSGACYTAAGMISPLAELFHCPLPIYELGMCSLQYWPQWVARLEQEVGVCVDYRQSGSVLVAHPQDRSELLQFQQELAAKLGGAGDDQLRWLDSRGLNALEPELDRFEQGLFLASEADVDNRKLLPALLQAVMQNGVRLHEHTAVECAPNEVHTARGSEAFDLVIDARGLGAKDAIQGLRGVRGEVMVVETAEVQLQRPVRLLHPRYQLYAVPRDNNQTVIGATEIESEDMSPISLRSSMELSSALYSIHPAFAEARVIETRVNCRPATMDNLPVVESTPGLIRVNGLFRHGYLLAPALVLRVEDALSLLIQETQATEQVT